MLIKRTAMEKEKRRIPGLNKKDYPYTNVWLNEFSKRTFKYVIKSVIKDIRPTLWVAFVLISMVWIGAHVLVGLVWVLICSLYLLALANKLYHYQNCYEKILKKTNLLIGGEQYVIETVNEVHMVGVFENYNPYRSDGQLNQGPFSSSEEALDMLEKICQFRAEVYYGAESFYKYQNQIDFVAKNVSN